MASQVFVMFHFMLEIVFHRVQGVVMNGTTPEIHTLASAVKISREDEGLIYVGAS